MCGQIRYFFFRFGLDKKTTLLHKVHCSTSLYLVILQCSFAFISPSLQPSCTDNDDVSVVCCELIYSVFKHKITFVGIKSTWLPNLDLWLELIISLMQQIKPATNCENFTTCIVTMRVYAFNLVSTRIWDSPYSGQVRLTGGATVNQGLVEVYCSGQWGTVCDDSFGQNDANTVCRQLGYQRSSQYNHLSMWANFHTLARRL